MSAVIGRPVGGLMGFSLLALGGSGLEGITAFLAGKSHSPLKHCHKNGQTHVIFEAFPFFLKFQPY